MLSRTLRSLARANAHYDLVVIGSGPAAKKCAIDSAKRGKRVCMVDKNAMIGGVCVHTGTIPSKTFREAVLHLTGYRHKGFYGKSYNPWQKQLTLDDILARVKKVESSETDVIWNQLRGNDIEVITGTARFIGKNEPDAGGVGAVGAVGGVGGTRHGVGENNTSPRIMVLENEKDAEGRSAGEADTSLERHLNASLPKKVISAEKFLIAVGTRPVRRPDIKFDGKQIFDSDQILWGQVRNIPKNLIVIGAGVIGMEYASIVNVIPGTNVTVIDNRPSILGFADREVIDALCYNMRQNGARFILNDTVDKVALEPVDKTKQQQQHSPLGVNGGGSTSGTDRVSSAASGGAKEVVAYCRSGKIVHGDALLYTLGRMGNTDSLNLGAVGVKANDRGLIEVSDFYQTCHPSIYAAGDCIGYPALASTSMEQGRRASMHMWSDIGQLRQAVGAEVMEQEEELLRKAKAKGKGKGKGVNTTTNTTVTTASAMKDDKDIDVGVASPSPPPSITPTAPMVAAPIPIPIPVGGGDATACSSLMFAPGGGGVIYARLTESLFPYGIYTIPEVSMVGKSEEQLTSEHVTYEVGIAPFSELAKGQMLGGTDGFLKLLFCPFSLKLLGVHAIGEGATEIIHIGQVLMSTNGSIDYFLSTVFNYPTMAEAYNVAAADGLRKVGKM